MKDDLSDRLWRWALPGSFALHLLIAALLIFGLPISLPQPAEEQAIAVEVVPPPEQEHEEAKAEPPAKEPEKAPQSLTQPAPPPGETATPQTPQALQPVFRFGERDAGPRQAADGSSAEDGSAPPPRTAETAGQEGPAPSVYDPAATNEQASDTDGPEATPDTNPAEATDSDETEDLSAALTAPRNPAERDTLEPHAESATAPGEEVQLPDASPAPAPRPAETAEARSAPRLQEAGQLYSQAASGAQTATTAMGGLPREVRGGRLCVTELREQLLRGSPPYFPDLLPSYPLREGTVIEVSNAAFRIRGRWYDLGFRCEVDADATRVVSFAFRVGPPLPRSEWASRGLPAQ